MGCKRMPEKLSVDEVKQSSKGVLPLEDRPELRSVPGWLVWVAASICFATGVFSAYSFKMMNRMEARGCRDCEASYFEGAWLQSLLMFIAEASCLLLYVADVKLSRRSNKCPFFSFVRDYEELEQVEGRWWWWTIPALFDFGATTLCNISLLITYASTVQMLRNFMVVITALMQILLVRKALLVYQWVGVIAITVAMILAAIPALQTPDTSGIDPSKTPLGIVFAILGTSLQAIQISFEEWLFRKGRYSAVKAVGIEGCVGIIVAGATMPIAEITGADKVYKSIFQLLNSGSLIGMAIAYMISANIFNWAGVSTTKLGSGLLRGVIFALRAPAIWVLELLASKIKFDYYNLGALFVFLIGFGCFVNIYPKRCCGAYWAKPVHTCIGYTKRSLDSEDTNSSVHEEQQYDDRV